MKDKFSITHNMKNFKFIYEDYEGNELDSKKYDFENSLEAQKFANKLFANSNMNDLAIIKVIEY